MENLLNKAKELADEAEIVVFETEHYPVNFEGGNLQDIKTKKHTDISLRVFKDGRMGRTCGNSFDEKLITDALEVSKFSSPENYHFAPVQDINYATPLSSEKVKNLTLKELVEGGKSVLAKLKGKAPHINADFYNSKTICKTKIATTNGFNAEFEKTYYEMLLAGNTSRGAAKVYEEKLSGDFFEFEDEKIDKLIYDYELAEKPARIQTKKMPVIFTYPTLWGLFYRLALGISAEYLEKKISPLIDKLDKQIFHPCINVYDDPFIPYAYGSMPFDDEGMATYKKPIIENGVLKNFLYDLRTASKLGAKSTGSGFKKAMHGAGIGIPPAPYPSNLFITPGARKLEDIIKDLPEAILVKQCLGWHSGNLTQGEFSVNIGMGYLIKDGVPQGRVLDTMVSGNIYECFKDILELSSTSKEHAWGVYPDIAFNNMSVTGKQ